MILYFHGHTIFQLFSTPFPTIIDLVVIDLTVDPSPQNLNSSSKCGYKLNERIPIIYIIYKCIRQFRTLLTYDIVLWIFSRTICEKAKTMIKGVLLFPLLPSVDFVPHNLQKKKILFLLFPSLLSL